MEDNIITCEYCDTPFDEDDECPTCEAHMKEQQAYYSALFAGQHHYSKAEIEGCYSEQCEYNKREGALRMLGL